MLYVGIDWSSDHHDVCLTNDSAQTLAAFRIAHDSEGFQRLHRVIKEHQSEPHQVLVALETARGLLVHDLMRSGYQVYAINPKAVNRYKDRYAVSKAKTDSLDASCLAHLLRTDRHRFKPLVLLPEDYRLLDRLCSDLGKLVDDRTRVVNQINDCLKEFYPQPLGLFYKIDSAISLAFLETFSDPQTLLATTKRRFRAFLKQQNYPYLEKADQLYDKIHAPAPEADPVIVKTGKVRLEALLDQFLPVREHQKVYQQQIRAVLRKLPESKPIRTLPGLGKRLVPELVAVLGPRRSHRRFDSAQALSNLAGCSPITQASGKWKTVRMRTACVKPLRRTFRHWSFASLTCSKWAWAYYQYRRSRNHLHETILRGLAQKWTKILFAVWTTGQPYDERLHIQRLKQHGVSWALSL
jgi:transposase